MQATDTTLILDLDERNLAHFLSALSLTALAQRVEGSAIESRRCWWAEKPGQFAIHTEHPSEKFRLQLFEKAHHFLKAMRWHSGLGGASSGLVTSGDEIGVNPFVGLSGGSGNTPVKVFAGNQSPAAILDRQKSKLSPKWTDPAWLQHRALGECRWGFDCRVRMHASDTGYSPDAEGTGDYNPVYPAVELLSFAAIAFFVPAHAWQSLVNDRAKTRRVEKNTLQAVAWSQDVPLPMSALAATGRIQGLPARPYKFGYRPAGHGDAGKYKFFPPATLQPSIP